MTNKQSVEELEEELLKVMQGHFYPEQDGKELIEAYKQAIREEERKDIIEFLESEKVEYKIAKKGNPKFYRGCKAMIDALKSTLITKQQLKQE